MPLKQSPLGELSHLKVIVPTVILNLLHAFDELASELKLFTVPQVYCQAA